MVNEGLSAGVRGRRETKAKNVDFPAFAALKRPPGRRQKNKS
jgi:hypothetical protein